MEYEDKNDRFEFEKTLSFNKLVVWRKEALNLFYSAEVLYEFESLKLPHLFERNETFSSLFPSDLTNRAYFNHGVQRMLWAYAFENLLKMIILARIKRENPGMNQVPLNEIRDHNLERLAQRAGIGLSETESFYFGVLEKCSVWAGRYPLPMRSSQMYESREGVPTREALMEHERQTIEKYLKGEIPRIECESDVLHSGIGHGEYLIYQGLKTRLLEITEGIDS